MFPYAGKDVEKLDCLCTAGGDINGAATLEKSLTVFMKLNIHLPYSPTPGCLHKRNENLRSHKRPYINIHSSFISNSLNQETSQTSLEGRMDNKTVVRLYHGILFSNRKAHTLHTTGMDLRALCWVKESQSQGVTYCMIPFIAFSKRQNYSD